MPVPGQRDLAADEKRLVGWFRRKLPSAREVRVLNLRAPGNTGFSNETFLFDLEWTDGKPHRERLVIRIEPRGFRVFPSYDVGLQFRTLDRLAATDVPVPKMFWLEKEDEEVLGAPFFVMGHVEGRVPSDTPPFHQEGWVAEMQPAERAELWYNGLEVLARIHKLDYRALGFDFIDHPELGSTPFAQQLAYYERFLQWAAEGRPQPVTAAALEWLKSNLPREDEPRTICWGDSRVSNMLWRGTKPVAVLDWEMVWLGNPEQDLAWWIFTDRALSEGLDIPRLEGMPGEEDTVAFYERQVGRKVRHLRFYEVWAGFRFGVIMIRIGKQLEDNGVMARELNFGSDNMVTKTLARIMGLPEAG